MALLLTTANPYDGEAKDAYWKVVDLNCNWLNKNCHVSLLCWIDQQARLDGKQPIAQRSFDWSGEDFDFDIEGNLVAQAYEKIKTLKVSNLTLDGLEEVDGEFAKAEDA